MKREPKSAGLPKEVRRDLRSPLKTITRLERPALDLSPVRDAISASSARSKARLSAAMAELPTSVFSEVVEPARFKTAPKPVEALGANRHKNKLHEQHKAFNEPAKQSDNNSLKKPREYGCKDRPKHNRPKKGGGSGSRGFIPWC